MKEDLDGEEVVEECYGGGEECYINYEIWRRGGSFVFGKNWVLLPKRKIESDKLSGRETRCSRNSEHRGRGGVLWV